MNGKLIGGGIVAVIAVAAGLYFGVLNKGGSSSSSDPKLVQERADKVLAQFKQNGGEASYKSGEATGDSLVLKDISASRKLPSGKPFGINIGELRINKFDWANPKSPSVADVEYKKLTFPALKDETEFKEFSSVTGLAEVVANLKINYKYDQATKTIDLSTGDFEVENMGTLSLTAKIEGVDVAQFEGMQNNPDPGKLMGTLAAARIHGLRIAFKDAGGVAKVIKFGAHKEKKTEDDIRQQALSGLAMAKAAPFKIARDAAAAAEKFIKSPGTFVIEAKPKAPFALAQLMSLMGKPDPAAIDNLVDQLGLTVAAN